MLRRLTDDETFFAELGFHFSYFMQRVAKLRDNGDSINSTITRFLMRDDPCAAELKRCLEAYRNSLASVQDYRDAEARRLEERVVKPLNAYAGQFKRVRKQLSSANSARLKQMKEANKLSRQLRSSSFQGSTGSNLAASQQSSQSVNSLPSMQGTSGSGLSGVAIESLLQNKQLSDELRAFEQRKLDDLKGSLLEYLKIEMVSASKHLELLTAAYTALSGYDTKSDLARFCKQFLKEDSLELSDPKKERETAKKAKSKPASSSPRKPSEPLYSTVQKNAASPARKKDDDHHYDTVGSAEPDDDDDDDESPWDDDDDDRDSSKSPAPKPASAPAKNPPARPTSKPPVFYENEDATRGKSNVTQQDDSDDDFDSEDLSVTPRNAQSNRTMLSSKSVSFAK